MEFHISRSLREKLNFDDLLFSYTGNVVFGDLAASRRLAAQWNAMREAAGQKEPVHAGALFAMGLIDELSHAMVARYRKDVDPAVLAEALRWFEKKVPKAQVERLLLAFTERFPSVAVYRGEITAAKWLAGTTEGMPNREAALEELLLLWLANLNTAFKPFKELFEDARLRRGTAYPTVTADFKEYFATRPPMAPEVETLLDALRAPMLASPDSLTGQLDYIREHWVKYLGEDVRRVLLAVDVLREEEIAIWMRFHPPGTGRGGQGGLQWRPEGFAGDEYVGFEDEYELGPDGVRRRRRYAADHQAPLNEYEAFSQDQAWMPNVVLMAKSTYVWLEQLSRKYQRHIHRLDQIPDEELRLLAERGMTGLWLIGLWERSTASQTIKRLRGQHDAVASAYSLKEYRIAEDLGGTSAYEHLRNRAAAYGIRLASDMVPNHMGIDSKWVIEHPDWFISRNESPFPSYSFEGPDLSTDSRVEIKIDDHYYDQTDAAVAFRLRQHYDGRTRYMYHGNDGTTFAWNDTAQLDYSKHAVREQVIQTIFEVARLFPIIRFDAAMTLAKRHVQRLWFPLPGVGGAIPSRSENAMSQEEFDALMPAEFWREVVDRVAVEVPGTLLLAEAFWLLESYFVRTLGMHRVYNSAFMNMMRDEENAKYRSYLKKTIEFDPDILKRYVNFMSNPDERTAIDQFGTGDKFFGTSMLLATLPGLPMFAHGEIEGLTERYGMDFKHPRLDEKPNEDLLARHQREIAPLLKNRPLFAESSNFVLYDFWTEHGTVDENVFAYSNRVGDQRALLLYNNRYENTRGTIHISAAAMDKGSGALVQRSLRDGLALPWDESVFISYRDTMRGLEYLRRGEEIAHRGLWFELNGFGYMALQDWRERRASAEQPWGELCDALEGGGGVPSLDEAISKLRLRPLHEALRRALALENVKALAEMAEARKDNIGAPVSEAPAGKGVKKVVERAVGVERTAKKSASLKPPEPVARKVNGRTGKAAKAEDSPGKAAPQTANGRGPDARLDALVQQSLAYYTKWKEMSGGERVGAAPLESEGKTARKTKHSVETADEAYARRLRQGLEAALAVSAGLQKRKVEWPHAAATVLPLKSAGTAPERIWAPILAWIVLRSLPDEEGQREMFDRLQLRGCLAESFDALGIAGEDAWRAAARVRLLLSPEKEIARATVESRRFWDDPDVRWLAGINVAFGIFYLQREGFEELMGWLQLPELIAAAEGGKKLEANGASKYVAQACRAAAAAGYDLDRFLASGTTLPSPMRRRGQAAKAVAGRS